MHICKYTYNSCLTRICTRAICFVKIAYMCFLYNILYTGRQRPQGHLLLDTADLLAALAVKGHHLPCTALSSCKVSSALLLI